MLKRQLLKAKLIMCVGDFEHVETKVTTARRRQVEVCVLRTVRVKG